MRKIYPILLSVLGLGTQVNAQCPTPTLVTANPSVICAGNTASLNATSLGSSIRWYTVPTCGIPTGTSSSGSDYTVNATSTTTYYAEAFTPAAAGGSMVLNYTGCMQQIVIPPSVTQVTIMAYGAQGGSNAQGVLGGIGGMATGILTVSPGQSLNVYVGGSNGFNGGGIASNTACTSATGGNGGGASDVRVIGTSLNDRVIVAGGGGGAGGNRIAGCGRGSGGGGGGGYYGGGGGAAWPQTSIQVPTGGDQVSGGIGGTSSYATAAPNNNGNPGSLGQGGNGGIELSSNQAGSWTAATGGVGGGTVGAVGIFSGDFSGQSGAGGSSYIGGVLNGTTIAGTQTGNGQVIILGINGGCVSASRTAVTLSVIPSPTLSITGGTSAVCPAVNTTLTASGATSYTWSTSSNSSTIVVNPTVTTTYTLSGSDGICASNTVKTITVSPSLSVIGNPSVCAGNSVVITASGADTYTWSSGPNANTISVTPSVTSVYTVSGTSTLTSCSSQATHTITVFNLPTLNIVGNNTVCAGVSTTLSASGAPTYTWSNGSNTNSIVVAPSTNTVYSVSGSNNCGTSTSSITVVVTNCTGFANQTMNNELIKIYPNPANSIVTINCGGELLYSFELTDLTGRLISKNSELKGSHSFNVSELNNGIYQVKVSTQEGTAVLKLVKE